MGGTTKVREWPKQTRVLNGKEVPVKQDAHHIIPQEVKGPHVWWNMHPVKFPEHQAVIHGSGSKLSELLRSLAKNGQ